MNGSVKPNPWTEWAKEQQIKAELAHKSRMSGWKKQDWILAIKELKKLKGSLEVNERNFINRLDRYNEGIELSKDEFRYLAKVYHTVRKDVSTHEERCPVCKGQISLE